MAKQLPLDELSTVIARIQGLLLTEEKVNTAVRLLAQAAKESVPGAIGAGVSLMDARGRRTCSGYTDTVVAEADAAQYECGDRECGVLMERLGIGHEAALQWLIRHARDENAALQDISERVLAGTPASGR